ncbi:Dabb family protein [Arcicella sp. LKC2W]|uniref:Dabb family protein n=1 Tax=Arcicella sp. LKC2W TaxID=2984198 RepID=UPI002B1FFF52|nr:Dabb family protein [Arcicella sp. LKC2W]MEA5460919.1 Dabb family protein [Arcicella sp. LKC2W]
MKSTTRRNFLKATAMTTVVGTTAKASDKIDAKQIFVHHVYFWLKNPSSEADKAKLLEGLEVLSKVPEIKMVHIGMPASTNRSVIERSYSVSWLLFFENLEQEEIYQKHPIHLKFVADYSHLWEKVIVYDSVGAQRK